MTLCSMMPLWKPTCHPPPPPPPPRCRKHRDEPEILLFEHYATILGEAHGDHGQFLQVLFRVGVALLNVVPYLSQRFHAPRYPLEAHVVFADVSKASFNKSWGNPDTARHLEAQIIIRPTVKYEFTWAKGERKQGNPSN